MEVKIGVVYTAKELVVELDDAPDEVVARVEQATERGTGVLWLADRKGRRIGIPVDKLAYVEFAADDAERRIGFGRS